MEGDIKRGIAHITNPDYLQQEMWSLIVEFVDIIKITGISAHSLMTALLYGVQTNSIEIWGALKDNKCIGFIVFQTLGPPYYSTGSCPYIYMQEKDEELVVQLYAKTDEYMKKNRLKYWLITPNNKKLADHFITIMKTLPGYKNTGHFYTYFGKRTIKGGKP